MIPKYAFRCKYCNDEFKIDDLTNWNDEEDNPEIGAKCLRCNKYVRIKIHCYY